MFIITGSIIPSVSFNWRTGTLNPPYAHLASAGEVHFVNADGQSYDFTTVDCTETIVNFATDPECANVIVVTAEDSPSEMEERAMMLALHERELHADCFGYSID